MGRRRYADQGRRRAPAELTGTFGDEDEPVTRDHARDHARDQRMRDQYAAGEPEREEARQALVDDDQAELDDRLRSGRGYVGGRPSVPQGASDTAGGFLLGLLAWTLALNYFRGGLPLVRGWAAAKFLNRPYAGPVGTLPPDVKPATPRGPG